MSLTLNRSYYLEVNSVKLACPAWQAFNLDSLFDDADLRGSDRILPGAAGRKALRRVRDSMVKTIGLEVWGQRDIDGTRPADPAEKLQEHWDYLRANLGFAKSTGDGTVVVKFFRGPESTLQADAHFLGFKGTVWHPTGMSLVTTFDLSIPSGVWS